MPFLKPNCLLSVYISYSHVTTALSNLPYCAAAATDVRVVIVIVITIIIISDKLSLLFNNNNNNLLTIYQH